MLRAGQASMERVARGPVAKVMTLHSARVSSLHAPSAPMFCLVALAALFGGGVSPAPAAEIVVIVVAITFAALGVIFSPDRDLRVGPAHWAIALLLPALAVLQLLPLPLAFRQTLPLGSQLAAVLQAGGFGWPDAMHLAVMAFRGERALGPSNKPFRWWKALRQSTPPTRTVPIPIGWNSGSKRASLPLLPPAGSPLASSNI